MIHSVATRPVSTAWRQGLTTPTDVHVWFVATDDVRSAEWLRACGDTLSAEERARQQRFVFERDRHRYLVSHALVRRALSLYADVPPAVWSFGTTAHGSPFVTWPLDHRALNFNLSHTDGLSAVAIARNGVVGVDVESMRRRVGDLAIARHYFAPAEYEALAREPETRRGRAFLEIWTLKEAYIKARGLGLSIPLELFAFDRDQTGTPRIHFSPGLTDDPVRWWFGLLRPTVDHLLSVAVRVEPGEEVAVTVREAAFM